MSHHFVTVCVVCVLCAAHTPCSAHTDFSTIGQTFRDSVNSESLPGSKEQLQPSSVLLKSKDIQRIILNNLGIHKRPTEKLSNDIDINNNNNNNGNNNNNYVTVTSTKGNEFHPDIESLEKDEEIQRAREIVNDDTSSLREMEILERLGQLELIHNEKLDFHRSVKDRNYINRIRTKRDVSNIDEKYFMKKIFETYGDGTSVTMEGFEKLLRKLGLLRLLTDMSRMEDRDFATSQREKQLNSAKNLQSNGLPDYDGGITKERCLNSKELLNTVAPNIPYTLVTKNSTILPSWLFERVCPALVYQLAGESSSERNGCIRVPENYKPKINENYIHEEAARNMVQVWVYSTISILIISLCGLLGVAVIPVMGKNYYHHLLQFLVALAVGTLCGDAFIHLLPHAMSTHDHNHEHDHIHDHDSDHSLINHQEQHNLNMWKGLLAMMGLVLFFFTEKALMMLAEWRKLRQRRNKLPSRVRVMRETDGPNSNVVGEKLCKHKYSSYPYCYGEITTETQGHVHSAPESMSSVAWMVIMGDGLHNFTDGMAIGAAFAANIAGGFSTAIAVFCHELPHELGDFAVLLKAGMSAKQAVFYNLLSSVLCLFGMVFGVLLGSSPAATSWMFAAAAGMFIYIALVDMIPELSSSHSVERGIQWQCILQALGLACGLGIMLIIALYEHDLKNIFSD